MKIKLGKETVKTSADNTTLFTFAGQISMYNHVLVEGDKSFAQVFECTKQYATLYKQLAAEAIEGSYPAFLNQPGIDEDTIQQYARVAMREAKNIPDHLPIEWMRGN